MVFNFTKVEKILFSLLRMALHGTVENGLDWKSITEEEWKSILQEMVQLLRIMDVDDECFIRKHLGLDQNENNAEITIRIEQERVAAQNKFFELYNRWYWDLRY